MGQKDGERRRVRMVQEDSETRELRESEGPWREARNLGGGGASRGW